MPASLAFEEKVLNQVLKKEAFAETKTYLGLSTLTSVTLLKKTTGKEFGEAEPKEADGWVRVEVDALEWTVTKSETAPPGFTKYENKNAIKGAGGAGEFTKLTKGEYACKTFAILDKPKQGEVGPILVFGELTTPITVNAAATLEIAVGALKIECE